MRKKNIESLIYNEFFYYLPMVEKKYKRISNLEYMGFNQKTFDNKYWYIKTSLYIYIYGYIIKKLESKCPGPPFLDLVTPLFLVSINDEDDKQFHC